MKSFSPFVRFSAITLALLIAGPALAGYQIDGKPKVAFHAAGNPGALDIDGTTSDLALTDDGQTLTFVVKLDTVSTGIDLRDHHMKETYLQTAQYPTATLSLARSSVTFPAELGASQSGTSSATYTVHGVAQPVTVSWTAKRSKTGWRVTASFDFDANKHSITIPSYLGVTVEPAMKVEVTLDLLEAT